MYLEEISKDKHLFALADYPVVAVYDDSFYLRNDYDVLSTGQRHYLIKFFDKLGFRQKTGKTLVKDNITVHLPKPQSNLATSAFDKKYLSADPFNLYCLTPTQFAEVLFYDHQRLGEIELLQRLKSLIDKCPFNIEWLRDISYSCPIEPITKLHFQTISEYQQQVVAKTFKMKKPL
ncbi:MAG: hypothetical protein V2I33_14700 [Kangiellaceae bacterium]|jgi:hypothetical protein|nr:hypothetical protein [Kangiellaceae bacterium]